MIKGNPRFLTIETRSENATGSITVVLKCSKCPPTAEKRIHKAIFNHWKIPLAYNFCTDCNNPSSVTKTSWRESHQSISPSHQLCRHCSMHNNRSYCEVLASLKLNPSQCKCEPKKFTQSPMYWSSLSQSKYTKNKKKQWSKALTLLFLFFKQAAHHLPKPNLQVQIHIKSVKQVKSVLKKWQRMENTWQL